MVRMAACASDVDDRRMIRAVFGGGVPATPSAGSAGASGHERRVRAFEGAAGRRERTRP
jgi:hypothetical protein